MQQKKVFIIFILCSSMFLPLNAGAAQVIDPVDINRQTFFNDISDAMATIGKSDVEKKRVKHQRQLKRKRQRLLNELNKQKQRRVETGHRFE